MAEHKLPAPSQAERPERPCGLLSEHGARVPGIRVQESHPCVVQQVRAAGACSRRMEQVRAAGAQSRCVQQVRV